VWHGNVRQARQGTIAQVGSGHVSVRFGRRRAARLRIAGQGLEWHRQATLGLDTRGEAAHGKAGTAALGIA
jgi:hypothetical protein